MVASVFGEIIGANWIAFERVRVDVPVSMPENCMQRHMVNCLISFTETDTSGEQTERMSDRICVSFIAIAIAAAVQLFLFAEGDNSVNNEIQLLLCARIIYADECEWIATLARIPFH